MDENPYYTEEQQRIYNKLEPFEKAQWDYERAKSEGMTGAALTEVMRKWFLLASTTKEALKVWDYLGDEDDQRMGDVTLGWEEVFEKGLELAREPYDAWLLFDGYPSVSVEDNRAFEKMLSLAKSCDEVQEIWDQHLSDQMSPVDDEDLFLMIFKRVHELPQSDPVEVAEG
jgi:hypothetical protein